jgi:hypothetical protein
METTLYTLAELTRMSGAKRRSVQLWAEAGAIEAEKSTERAGTGVHRAFRKDEVLVACVVAAFALDNAPIGVLIDVGAAIRGLLRSRDRYSRELLYEAVRNTGEKYFFVYDQNRSPLVTSPVFLKDFGVNYLLGEMSDKNYKSNIVYLNGCFAGIRAAHPDFCD